MTGQVLLVSAVLGGLLPPAARGQAPEPESFRVRHATLEVSIDYATQQISGSMTYELENWTARPAAQVSLLLNRLMEASQVRDGNGAPVPYSQDVRRGLDNPKWQVTQLTVKLPDAVAPGARTVLCIDYAGYLVGYSEVGWLYVRDHVDTAFTILRSEALAFPVVGGLAWAANRAVPTVDFSYEVSVRVPPRLLVATGGGAERSSNADGTATWRYRSAGASPFLNIAIAPFDTLSAGGVRLFYFPGDSAGARDVMRSAQNGIRTLTQWYGPLHAPLSLTVAEIPDGWGSQASLVGGIIQTAAAFRDRRHMRELYHELTHLWNAPDRDNPSPRWNEGLASFLEDLLQERLDGWQGRPASDTWVLNTLKQAVAADSSVRAVPFIDYGRHAMTDRSYTVGNAMFEVLYGIVGEEEFNRIIGGYYQRFAEGGTTRDFVGFARTTAQRDLAAFFDDWLFTTHWTAAVAAASSMGDLTERFRAVTPPRR